MDEDIIFASIATGILSFMIGLFFGGVIIANSGGISVIQDKVLNETCTQIYGEGYYYDDVEVGTNTKLICTIDKIEPVEKQLEEPLIQGREKIIGVEI